MDWLLKISRSWRVVLDRTNRGRVFIPGLVGRARYSRHPIVWDSPSVWMAASAGSVVTVIHPAGCCRNKPGGRAFVNTRTSGTPLLVLLLSARLERRHMLDSLDDRVPPWVSLNGAWWASLSMPLMSDLALPRCTVIQRARHFWFYRDSDITQWGISPEQQVPSGTKRQVWIGVVFGKTADSHAQLNLTNTHTLHLQRCYTIQKQLRLFVCVCGEHNWSNLRREETNKPWQRCIICVPQMRRRKPFQRGNNPLRVVPGTDLY